MAVQDLYNSRFLDLPKPPDPSKPPDPPKPPAVGPTVESAERQQQSDGTLVSTPTGILPGVVAGQLSEEQSGKPEEQSGKPEEQSAPQDPYGKTDGQYYAELRGDRYQLPPEEDPNKPKNVSDRPGNGWNESDPGGTGAGGDGGAGYPVVGGPAAPGVQLNNNIGEVETVSPDETKFRQDLAFELIRDMRERDKWAADFRKAVALKSMESSGSGRRPWKLYGTMNGNTGQSTLRVEWDRGPESSSVVSSMPEFAPDRSYRSLFGENSPLAKLFGLRKSRRRGRIIDDPNWMPRDTWADDPDAPALTLADFDPENRTGRMQGGYFDPLYRQNFINRRMGGLVSGDAGYEVRRHGAELEWGEFKNRLDEIYRDYGKGVVGKQKSRRRGGSAESTAAAASKDAADAVANGANAPVRK